MDGISLRLPQPRRGALVIRYDEVRHRAGTTAERRRQRRVRGRARPDPQVRHAAVVRVAAVVIRTPPPAPPTVGIHYAVIILRLLSSGDGRMLRDNGNRYRVARGCGGHRRQRRADGCINRIRPCRRINHAISLRIIMPMLLLLLLLLHPQLMLQHQMSMMQPRPPPLGDVVHHPMRVQSRVVHDRHA